MSRFLQRSPAVPSAVNRSDESGKVGLALLMWLLGVPGSIVLLYLLFAH